MQGITGRAQLIWGFSAGEFLCVFLLLGMLTGLFLTQVPNIFPRIAATEVLNLAVRSKIYWAEQWAVDGVREPAVAIPLAAGQKGVFADALPDEDADGSVSYEFTGKLRVLAGMVLTVRPALSAGDLRSVIWVCGHAPIPRGFAVRGADRTEMPAGFLNVSCRDRRP